MIFRHSNCPSVGIDAPSRCRGDSQPYSFWRHLPDVNQSDDGRYTRLISMRQYLVYTIMMLNRESLRDTPTSGPRRVLARHRIREHARSTRWWFDNIRNLFTLAQISMSRVSPGRASLTRDD